MADKVALEVKNVSKRFPGTLAVDNVSVKFNRGEVHALMGENGAGKSTLMKMIAGSYNDYTGDILINGEKKLLYSPSISKKNGIGMIYQELSLARPISIAENILVGRLPVKYKIITDKAKMIEEAKECLETVRLEHLDPEKNISEISQHQAQLVEIAKVMGNKPSILVFDEPTSALSREEVEMLFDIINDLKRKGMAIIYISHHISEIYRIADKVTVMRDGKKIETRNITDVKSEELVQMMVGKTIDKFYSKRKGKIGKTYLEVKDLTRYGFVHNISFKAKKGEILGFMGLSGAGRTELARCIVGIDPIDKGTVMKDGVDVTPKNYDDGISKGFAYLSEDRKSQGLFLRLTNEENILSALIPMCSSKGIYKKRNAGDVVTEQIEKLKISPPNPHVGVGSLSGGNQQKVLLGKWLATKPDILILDEPTRGVDVGAKQVIHDVVTELANKGTTVLLMTSDLPELVGLSDRVCVIRGGHIIGEISKEKLTEESALLAANGEGSVFDAC
ncbi:ribose ABC transporter ATP-binding protein [Vallitalea longa]|uniref:Ribose ABC transporter ATP-binding protein n=1 Tax=Vallitalea longa TaxID=2936439 RepID=A0A9W5YBG4_9FIRM|nr:sugar ABC transporter ATP-binding protein [Vallitalea longa]GKX29303.1 ribose ABC transporter ATP-binding protein [Vallitalea longa]